MERMNVKPTRMMLTSLKRRLKTAVRGHKLLKDKRDELMKGFLAVARENGRLRKEVEEHLVTIYRNFGMSMKNVYTEKKRIYIKKAEREAAELPPSRSDRWQAISL